jgi:hypothetical protein
MKKKDFLPHNFYELLVFCVVIVSVLMVGAVILVLVFSYQSQNISTDILGLLPLILAIMVILIVPKYLVQNECKAYFYKKEFKDILTEDFATKHELYRADAHLSRAISVNLYEKYPIWAIGWAFRSLKRYDRLPESNTMYSDFLSSMNVIINICKEKIISVISDQEGNIIPEAVNELVNNSTPVSGDEVRVVERAVKDIIDYIIYGRINTSKNKQEESYYRILLLLVLVLYYYRGDAKTDFDNFEKLAERICVISDYAKTEIENSQKIFHNGVQDFFKNFKEEIQKDRDGFTNHIINEGTSKKYGKPLFDPKIGEKIQREYAM